MGYVEGFPKYVIGVLLSIWGFINMYIFGGGLFSAYDTIQYAQNGQYVAAFIMYFFQDYLPPTSVEQVFWQAIVGALVAGILWLIGCSFYKPQHIF